MKSIERIFIVLLIIAAVDVSSGVLIQNVKRRLTAAAIALTIPGITMAAVETPKMGECITTSNPSATTIFCRELGLKDNRLRGCRANENCRSTSSFSSGKQATPWYISVDGSNKESAGSFLILKNAVKLSGLTILREDTTKNYILAAEKNVPKQPAGSSLFYEFLIKPNENLILYRGVVDKTIFLYPLQQPVTDFGALDNRLNQVKEKGGFLSLATDSLYTDP